MLKLINSTITGPKIKLNGKCKPEEECVDPSALCIEGSCLCQENFFDRHDECCEWGLFVLNYVDMLICFMLNYVYMFLC